MSKKWTRRGALGLLAGGAGLLAWGSAGFTQIEAVRDAASAVVGDDDAVLRIVGEDKDGIRPLEGETFENGFTVEFENQSDGTFEPGEFEVELDGNVSGTDDGGDVSLVSTGDGTFENGDAFEVDDTARLEITSNGGDETFDVVVDGQNDIDTSVELSRTVTIETDSADQIEFTNLNNPQFPGAPNDIRIEVANLGSEPVKLVGVEFEVQNHTQDIESAEFKEEDDDPNDEEDDTFRDENGAAEGGAYHTGEIDAGERVDLEDSEDADSGEIPSDATEDDPFMYALGQTRYEDGEASNPLNNADITITFEFADGSELTDTFSGQPPGEGQGRPWLD